MTRETTTMHSGLSSSSTKEWFRDRTSNSLHAASDYATDFWQRSLMFLDILRKSGNQQAQMTSKPINAVFLRLQYAMFSDKNPMMRPVSRLSDKARAERKTPEADNPFVRMQEQVSDVMTAWLEIAGQLRDQTQEAVFHARRALFEKIRAIRTAAGELDGEARRRLQEIQALFEGGATPGAAAIVAPGRWKPLNIMAQARRIL